MQFKVFAQDDEEQLTSKVKISELPVYDDPPPEQYKVEPETISPYREKVSEVRKVVFGYLTPLYGVYENVQQKWEVSKAHTNDLVEYLRQDKDGIPRVAFISFTGVCGVLLGIRGGKIKKSLYGVSGALTGAAFVYPHHAVKYSKMGYYKSKDTILDLYHQATDTQPAKNEQGTLVVITEQKAESSGTLEAKSDTKLEKREMNVETLETKVEDNMQDHGMSKKEDNDMYSTRK